MESIIKFDYTPVIGWSVSRYDKFTVCKRQYYYDYYAKFDREYSKEKINKLKKLTSIPLETGNIVHDIIKTLLERLLKSEGKIDTGKFYDYSRRKTEEYYHSKTFAEIYYGEMNDIKIDELFNTIQTSLGNFLNSDRFSWLIKKALPNKANWIIEPSGYGETKIDGLKAYCKVDFLFPVNDRLYIMDWKTGKPNEKKHRKQLTGYSSWASFHFKKNPEEITPIIAHLRPVYKEMEIKINEYDIQDFSIQVRNETENMYSFCCNIEENIPKDKKEFKKTENTNICGYCNYRELCK